MAALFSPQTPVFFVLDEDSGIFLNLFQFRSADRKHYEDILEEPFYPGIKLTLPGLYNALIGKSFLSSSKYYRIQYDTRKRFCKRLDAILHGRPYPIESFDLFYSFIHSLNDEELFILFGSRITFV